MKVNNGSWRLQLQSQNIGIALALSLGAAIPALNAAEGGASSFPYGAQTTYAAFVPPPGTTSFYGYFAYYTADSFRDDSGAPIPGLELEFIPAAPRVVHTWKRALGGFKFSTGAELQYSHVKLKFSGGEDAASGPTLLGIEPIMITRSFQNLHALFGTVLYFPIGDYEVTDPVNSTLNYKSTALQTNVTWTPTPDWDLSLNISAEFKERNKESGYKSGNQGGVTYGFSHRPFADKRWDLGISGYYTQQFENDQSNAVAVVNGGQTRKFAYGPKLVYWLTPAAGIVLQWHHETNVRNAPKGDLYWIEFAFPL